MGVTPTWRSSSWSHESCFARTVEEVCFQQQIFACIVGKVSRNWLMDVFKYTQCLLPFYSATHSRASMESQIGGPSLERPGNLTGPKSYFEIKFLRKVGYVLTSNEVHFVSLADNFTVQFSNLLKLLSRMKNKTA